ncbi:MAG: MipA/OmpV family protein [Alphaproteobacteria bacterium]|nr:MipA/OmpV family protein [Alphaproteobacteria bacterium]
MRATLFVLTILALTASPAIAQQYATQQKPAKEKPDWLVGLGAGAVVAPAFEGSNDYNLMIFPDVRVTYKDKFFASVPEGIGYNVINQNGWRAGPIGKIRWGREEDGGSPWRVAGPETSALRGLGDVDTGFEMGVFGEYTWQHHYATKLELRRGVGAHEAYIVDVDMKYKNKYGDIGYAVGPRLTWASEDYHDTYFGVNAAQSARSGLVRYNPDSGVVSYGLSGFATMPITEQLRGNLFAGYDLMGSEPSDSPLIDQRGSEHQFMTGVGVTYYFGFN